MMERREIEQLAYERAAQRIEGLHGNELYCKAWKRAAKAVRELMKFEADPQKLNDNVSQIGSSSGSQDDASASHPSR